MQKHFKPNLITTSQDDSWWEEPEVYWRGSYYLPYFEKDILFKRIKKKIERVLNIDPKLIDENSTLIDDLQIDSLESPALIRVLEFEYDLERKNDLAAKIQTIGHLIDYCELTWRTDDLEVWFRDPTISVPKRFLKIRKVLKFINQYQPINAITTFIRQFFEPTKNPLWIYIVQGRIRWLLLKEQNIDFADEILPEEEQDWEKWYEWSSKKFNIFLQRVAKFHPKKSEN